MIVEDNTSTLKGEILDQSSVESETVDNVNVVTENNSRDDLRAIENVAEGVKQVQLMPLIRPRPSTINTDGGFSSVVVHGGESQDSPRSEVKVSYARPMQLTHWSDMDVSGGKKQEWTFDSEPPLDIKKTRPKKKEQFRVRFNSPLIPEHNTLSVSNTKPSIKAEQNTKTFGFLRMPENDQLKKQRHSGETYKWKNIGSGVEVSSNLLTTSEHPQIPGHQILSSVQSELNTVKQFDHENALGNSDTFDQSNAIIKPRDQLPVVHVHDSVDYSVDSGREATRMQKALNRGKEESPKIPPLEPEPPAYVNIMSKQVTQSPMPSPVGIIAQPSDLMRPFVAEIQMPGHLNKIPALIIPMPHEVMNSALAGLQEGNLINAIPQIPLPFENNEIRKPFPVHEPLHQLRGQTQNFGDNISPTQGSPQPPINSAILKTHSTDIHINGPTHGVKLLPHPHLVRQQSSPLIRFSPDPNLPIFSAIQSGSDLLGQRGPVDQRNRPVLNRDQLLQQSISQWNQQYLTTQKNPLHLGPQVLQQTHTRIPTHGAQRPYQQHQFHQRPPSSYPQYPGLAYPHGQAPRQTGISPHYGLNGIMSQHFQLPLSKNPPSDGQYILVGDKNVCAINGQCFGTVNNADERP